MLTFREYFYVLYVIKAIIIKATNYQMDDRGSIQGKGWVIILF
jgi:hypothetical protein